MKRRLIAIIASVFIGAALAILVSVVGNVSAAPSPSSLLGGHADRLLDVQTVITVPYRYQGEDDGRTDDQKAHDCGQASVAMAIQYATQETVTVKAIHDYVGISGNTGPADLKRALDHWHIDYESVTTSAEISKAIQNGYPVLAAIQASDIPQATDYCATKPTDPSEHFNRYFDYFGGHWLVAKGLASDGQWVIVNDPNVWGSHPYPKYWYSDGTPKGASRYYSATRFAVAFDAINVEALKITTPAYIDRLDARIINQPPVQVLTPSQSIHIVFDIQNTSPVTLWAERTYLALLDESSAALTVSSNYPLDNDIPPGYQVSWEVEIIAPEDPGTYNLYWQMHFLGARFGPILHYPIYVRTEPDIVFPPPDDGGGVNPIELILAWLRSLWDGARTQFAAWVADLERQFMAWLADLERRLEVWLEAELARLIAELWEGMVRQCCGTSALVPLSVLGILYIIRRRS